MAEPGQMVPKTCDELESDYKKLNHNKILIKQANTCR